MATFGRPYEQSGEAGLRLLLHDFAGLLPDWRLTPDEMATLLRTTADVIDGLLSRREPACLPAKQWDRLRSSLALAAALKCLIGPEAVPSWLRTSNAAMNGEVPISVLMRDEGALPLFARILAAEAVR